MSGLTAPKWLVGIKKTFLNKKFVEFCLLGTINSVDNAFFSWFIHRFLIKQGNTAAIIGYILSLTLAFFLSCKVIFKSRPTVKKYFRFLLSYIPNFIIFVLVTFITINTLHLPQFWATIIAVMAGGPITFVIIKLYAFGKPNNLK